MTSAREFWEDLYSGDDFRWSGRANPVLVSLASPLTPATALDLGSGEGGDAMWLAERGWHVTAVDISANALRRAAEKAAAGGLGAHIDWQRHDLADSFPDGTFDLVSAQFLQSPLDFPRDDVLRKAALAVAPGGLLLVVSHAAAPPWAWDHGHDHGHDHEVHFPTPDEEVAALRLSPDMWRVDVASVVERQATGPDGTTGTLHDCVVAATRLATTVV